MPHLLSKHQGSEPRLLLSAGRGAARDVRRLRRPPAAAGFESRPDRLRRPVHPYDGVTIDRIVRALVRPRLRAEASGKGTGLGWSDSEGESLATGSPSPRRGRRRRTRTSVATSPRSSSSAPTCRWPSRRSAPATSPASSRWVADLRRDRDGHSAEVIRTTRERTGTRGVRADRPPRTRPPDLVPGIEVVGYLNVDAGLGETARQFVASLEHAGIPLSTTTYDRHPSRKGAPWTDRPAPAGARYDTALVCVNADMTPVFAATSAPTSSATATSSDCGSGSSPTCRRTWPRTRSSARRGLGLQRASTPRRCARTPTSRSPSSRTRRTPRSSRRRVARDRRRGPFTFLFVFDQLQRPERKNPVGLIEAFEQAFPTPGEARLVIKTHQREQAAGRRRSSCATPPSAARTST